MREYSEPVNHVEVEVEASGPVLLPQKLVTVNGTNIYNCSQVQVEQVPGEEHEVCQVTLTFRAVTNVYSSSADREPRSVEQPEPAPTQSKVLSEQKHIDRLAKLMMRRD